MMTKIIKPAIGLLIILVTLFHRPSFLNKGKRKSLLSFGLKKKSIREFRSGG
jgi:hypothetical protein